MNNDEHNRFMHKCLALAYKGLGNVSPNPMVAAIVVKNGKVVGSGYHKKFGGAHAEVEALNQAGKRAEGATLYVNLEPCCFFGKTPPCTDLIISKKIKRVVIGMRDPNPLVSGKGVAQLKINNIDVVENVLNQNSLRLNEVFIKYITTGLPFVTVKIAQTLDGKIADSNFDSQWITNLESRTKAHRLRAFHDAIIVGSGTIKKDNPKLTVRFLKGRNPIRIIIDGKLKSPIDSFVFSSAKNIRTIVFISESVSLTKKSKLIKLSNMGVETYSLKTSNDRFNMKQVLRCLAKLNIASVLVEGGSDVSSQFIENNLADKMIVFVAPKIIGSGKNAIVMKKKVSLKNAMNLTYVKHQILGNDIMLEGYLLKSKIMNYFKNIK